MTELELLAALGLPAPRVAPAFCRLLRYATQAEWVLLQWRDDGLKTLQYACLGADASRRGRLIAALDDDAALSGCGARVLTRSFDADGDVREGSLAISAITPRGPRGELRVHAVGQWSERADLNRAVTAVMAGAGALARCALQGTAPVAESPALELCEGLLFVAPDGAPVSWSPSVGSALATLRDSLSTRPDDAELALRYRLRALVDRPGLPTRRAQDTVLPVERFESPFGSISLQGLRLLGSMPTAMQPLACTCETPLAIALIEGVANTPLSPRQKQVAFHAANGESYPGISQRLGVSRATVIDYMQGVYEKLAVTTHEELAVNLAARRAT